MVKRSPCSRGGCPPHGCGSSHPECCTRLVPPIRQLGAAQIGVVSVQDQRSFFSVLPAQAVADLQLCLLGMFSRLPSVSRCETPMPVITPASGFTPSGSDDGSRLKRPAHFTTAYWVLVHPVCPAGRSHCSGSPVFSVSPKPPVPRRRTPLWWFCPHCRSRPPPRVYSRRGSWPP